MTTYNIYTLTHMILANITAPHQPADLENQRKLNQK